MPWRWRFVGFVGDERSTSPGYIKVDSGTSPPTSDFETALIKNTPWGGWARWHIAPAALFLASRRPTT
jgi:hypothetical protein